MKFKHQVQIADRMLTFDVEFPTTEYTARHTGSKWSYIGHNEYAIGASGSLPDLNDEQTELVVRNLSFDLWQKWSIWKATNDH